MYVVPVDKKMIISFMSAVDVGLLTTDIRLAQKSSWTALLSDFIKEKKGIEPRALGWPNQVETFAGKTNLPWEKAFFLLMQEMIKTSDSIPFTSNLQEIYEGYFGEK